MITRIDRATCRLIQSELQPALEQVGQKLGLSITLTPGTFTPQNLRCKVEVAVKDENGEAMREEVMRFKSMAKYVGMKAEDLGRTFRWGGKEYTIVGMTGARRLKVVGKDAAGRQYTFIPSDVKQLLD